MEKRQLTSRSSTGRASTIAARSKTSNSGSRSLGRQPAAQVRSQVEDLQGKAAETVSVVNRPSKYDRTIALKPLDAAEPVSRSSTGRASTIARARAAPKGRRSSLGRQPAEQVASTIARSDGAFVAVSFLVSVVNRPSKYDHPVTTLLVSVVNQPSSRASTITARGQCDRHDPQTVSVVNRPSKYDHSHRPLRPSIGSRPSTNRASTITRAAARPTGSLSFVVPGEGVVYGSRPSTNRASTITADASTRDTRLEFRVSAVNQPSKYDHPIDSHCAAAASGLGRQPTEQVRSLGGAFGAGVGLVVSAVNQPSKYDHPLAPRAGGAAVLVSAVNQPSKYDHPLT